MWKKTCANTLSKKNRCECSEGLCIAAPKYFHSVSQEPALSDRIKQMLLCVDKKRNKVMTTSPISYKSTVSRLKALKTEIEHLQLLLERAKVKLQTDFNMWWNQEASDVQVTDLTSLYIPMWQHIKLLLASYVSDISQEICHWILLCVYECVCFLNIVWVDMHVSLTLEASMALWPPLISITVGKIRRRQIHCKTFCRGSMDPDKRLESNWRTGQFVPVVQCLVRVSTEYMKTRIGKA